MSTAVASHLSPAFPERAAWGTASELRVWQADALAQYLRSTPRDLDEIHHGGDNLSWGDAIREAFEPATRRLALTGTPFRSDTSPIPFVRYQMGADSICRSQADYTYGYAEALRDGVVRTVLFLAYGGSMRWRTKAGDEMSAGLGEPMTKDATAHPRARSPSGG